MTPRLYKVAEVCEIVQLQPYVLRSWEKEFPGIGLQRSEESPRLYRQSDVEQVRRIKELVFGEGLTLAGARRRLEESSPAAAVADETDVIEVLGADVRKRIMQVRDGLRSLMQMLDGTAQGEQYALKPSLVVAASGGLRGSAQPGKLPARGKKPVRAVKTKSAKGRQSSPSARQ